MGENNGICKSKTILTKAKNGNEWYGVDYNMNLYRGCSHGCIYCDSRSRSLELYGYNLEFMLNSSDSSDDNKQEKLALLKYTYEQIHASQAEQVQSKSNNRDNLSNLGKNLIKNNIKSIEPEVELKIV